MRKPVPAKNNLTALAWTEPNRVADYYGQESLSAHPSTTDVIPRGQQKHRHPTKLFEMRKLETKILTARTQCTTSIPRTR